MVCDGQRLSHRKLHEEMIARLVPSLTSKEKITRAARQRYTGG
jgi:hypothetical protein